MNTSDKSLNSSRWKWRRFLQVRLSIFLFIVTLLPPLLCGWIIPSERQRRRVEEMKELGWAFKYRGDADVLCGLLPSDYVDSVVAVSLSGCDFTPGHLDDLKYFTSIRELDLSTTKIGDSNLDFVAHLDNLESLNLSGTQISTIGLAKLGRLRRLKSIKLTRPSFDVQSDVTDESISVLARLPLSATIESIDLAGAAITDRALFDLSGMPRLSEIRLDHTRVTDRGIVFLCEENRLPRFEKIFLHNTQVTDDCVPFLAKHTRLRYLDLGGCDVSDRSIDSLATMSSLEYLSLSHERGDGAKVTDLSAVELAKLKTLRHLDLSWTSVGDAGLEPISQLPQLESLILSGTHVTSVTLAKLDWTSKLRVIDIRRLNENLRGSEAADGRRAVVGMIIRMPDLSVCINEDIDDDFTPCIVNRREIELSK